MANAEHLAILKEGVEVWNMWRKENEDPDINLLDVYKNGIINLEKDYTAYRYDLSEADLSEMDLKGANLSGVNLKKANLTCADLRGANFQMSKLSYSNLEAANLIDSNLEIADLYHADLSGADLSGSNLCYANLEFAKFYSTKITYANLYGAKLTNATFMNVDLSGANLCGANLSYVFFSRLRLIQANLSNAKLCGTNLTMSNLSESNLSGADLTEANLTSTIIERANFTNSLFGGTVIGNTDLSTCIGLETIKVENVCIIDFQTLRRSNNLPKSFLLKIGLPELYIDYLPDFFQPEGIRYYPVFLSHSWANKPFARKLYEALIAKGVNVFFDEKKMKPGDDIFTSLSRGIELYDKTILVCSEESLNSWWVDQELELVFEKERNLQKETGEKTGLLIPIRIDDHIDTWANGKRMAIKQRVIGDFRNWQDDGAFDKSLNDLVHALNADRLEVKPPSFIRRT